MHNTKNRSQDTILKKTSTSIDLLMKKSDTTFKKTSIRLSVDKNSIRFSKKTPTDFCDVLINQFRSVFFCSLVSEIKHTSSRKTNGEKIENRLDRSRKHSFSKQSCFTLYVENDEKMKWIWIHRYKSVKSISRLFRRLHNRKIQPRHEKYSTSTSISFQKTKNMNSNK